MQEVAEVWRRQIIRFGLVGVLATTTVIGFIFQKMWVFNRQ